jgi:universal stress protein A
MLHAADLLVPVDFSECSVNAVRAAIGIAAPDGDVTLLHVVEESFIAAAVEASMGNTDEITARLRERAEGDFTALRESLDPGEVHLEQMVVVGTPFVEILKIARDLQLPMIVMGVRGRSTPPAELLFGSTAEKVVCGSRVPVLCIPF